MWRCCIAVLAIAGIGCHSWAQNVVFTAQAGANKIGKNNQVQVQYTIRDAQNLQTVSRPSTPDFDIVAGPYQSQSSSAQFDGNAVVQSTSISLTYVLQPKREGTFTIPPVVARDAAGHAYLSNALTIQVVPGTVSQQQGRQQDPYGGGGGEDVLAMLDRMQRAQQQQYQQRMQQYRQQQAQQPQPQQPQPVADDPKQIDEEINKNIFIRVVTDKSKVHVGEQITTSYKLYAAMPMNMNISKLPNLDGFWTQDFDIPKVAKPTEEVFNGKKYQVFLLKKSALFPQQTGTLTLDPTEVKGVARIVQQVKRRMSEMFGGTFMMNDPVFNNSYYNTLAYRDVEATIKSNPVKITVVPLPDKGKPADYGGAVGKYSISSKLDKPNLSTDDVATLTLTISGSGNIKLMETPKLELPNGLNTYDPQVSDTITSRSTTISGSKMISYVITPRTPGDYEIPPISFSYYNPEKGEYVTEQTQPMKIHVKPGKHYVPTQSASGGGNLALKDIHDISKQPISNLTLNSKPMLFTPGYWSLYALPLVTFIGMLVWKRREDEQSKDTVSLRRRRANRIALQRLTTAKKLLEQNNKTPFYEEISKAIWLYLSDKLSIPLSSLSRDTAAEAMNRRKVPATVQLKLEHVIWECETALYASGGSQQMANTYEEAIRLISDLEEVFKS